MFMLISSLFVKQINNFINLTFKLPLQFENVYYDLFIYTLLDHSEIQLRVPSVTFIIAQDY